MKNKMHCLQRAGWRNGGSNSAERLVKAAAAVKPSPRCTQASENVADRMPYREESTTQKTTTNMKSEV